MKKLVLFVSLLLTTACAFDLPPHPAATPKLGAVNPITWAGDLNTSTNVSQTVTGVQGHSVPTPTGTNTLLTWTGAAYAWNNLGLSALAPGTAGQFVVTNSGATAAAWASVGGDLVASTSTPGNVYVATLNGGTSAGPVDLTGTYIGLNGSGATYGTQGQLRASGAGNIIGGYSGATTYVAMSEDNAGGLYIGAQSTGASNMYGFTYVAGSSGVAVLNSSFTTNAFLSNTNNIMYWGGAVGSAPAEIDWSTSTAPWIHSGTSATSLGVGTNKAGAGLLLQTDAAVNIMQLYGGTQNSIALGANLAASGHLRFPNGFNATMRSLANTVDYNFLSWSTGSILQVGDNTPGPTQIWGGTNVGFVVGGATSFQILTSNMHAYRDAATLYDQQVGAGNGHSTTFQAQAGAGSGNTGGQLILAGGASGGGGAAAGTVEVSTGVEDIDSVAAPAAPSAGKRRVYVDSADNKLKVQDPAGNIYELTP